MSARWLARAAFVLMFASAVVLIGFPERHARGAVVTVAIGAVAAGLIVAGGYVFLAHRGVLRQLGLGLVVLVPVAVLVVFAVRHVIWVAVVAVVLLALGVGAARLALAPAAADPGMPLREVPPPQARVPDHEPAVGRREGRQVRPETEGRGAGRPGGAARRPRPGGCGSTGRACGR